MAVTLNASTSSGFIQTADTSGELNLQSNGTTRLSVLSTGVSGTLVQGTAVASTSGTSIDFTSIPSWVKRVVIAFNGVSVSGTGNLNLLIGPVGGVESTGYVSASSSLLGSSVVTANSTTSFLIVGNNAAAANYQGSIILTNLSGNVWVEQGNLARTGDFGYGYAISGSKTLAGALSVVRITGNGTDTFDAGSINIQYEG
jgi:hypothetical protein